MAKPRQTPDAQLKKLLAEIEKHRAQAEKQGHHFTAPTEEQLREKLGRTNSPMIVSQGWSGAPAGGTVAYSVGVHNPDPTAWGWLFVHSSSAPPTSPPTWARRLSSSTRASRG